MAYQIPTGILAGAMPNVPNAQSTSTADKVRNVNAIGYNATNTGATGYGSTDANASTYDASKVTGTNWGVDNNQTVQGQIKGIVDDNSPLMQQAATRAKEQMASRGLVNSSMAVQAGQAAVYDSALPIAQADANVYANASRYNADVANTTSQFNATADNQANQFNTGQINDIAKQNASAKTDASRFKATAQNDADKFNAQAQTEAAKYGADAANTASKFNAEAANTAIQSDAKNSLQASLANQDAGVKLATQQYDAAVKFALQNADTATKVELANLDAGVKTSLAQIEAQYKTQMQTSDSMSRTYQYMLDGITRIMQDKDMDAGAKQQAISNLTTMYNNALQQQSVITGLNLGSLLDASAFAGTPSKPQQEAAAQQAAPAVPGYSANPNAPNYNRALDPSTPNYADHWG